MRNPRWVAEHRGGPLKKAQHKQLIRWSIACAERVVPLFGKTLDIRLKNALTIAKEWAAGKATTGMAMKASVAAHAAARATKNPVAVAVARAIGHVVATAHMADHSLGGALYALKALKIAGKPIEAERKWQNEQLPTEIKDLVLTTRSTKEKVLKLESP